MREHPQHYEFAHKAVPQLMLRRPEWLFDHEDVEGLRIALGFAYGLVCQRFGEAQFAFEDIGVEERNVAGHRAVLITMPTPTDMCEAYYTCAVLLDPGEEGALRAAYFTLEYGQNGDKPPYAVVCSWRAGGQHCNHGINIAPDAAAFLAVVEKLLPGAAGGDPEVEDWGIPAFIRRDSKRRP